MRFHGSSQIKMEGNKDEAERCITIALKCMRSGEREKALKFLNKANRLYPSKRTSDLLDSLNNLGGASGEESRTDASSAAEPDQESELRHRKREEASKPEHTYTPEQYSLVNKILKCKDFYEVLDVPKSCNEEELKKAYKKLALKLHPDKNHAPGATEAFKAVARAFATLNDSEKRKRYDVFGNEAQEASSPRSRQQSGGRYYYYYEDDDISADEIFNMFFGTGFSSSHIRRRQQGFHQHQHAQTNNGTAQADPTVAFFYQLLPIITVLMITLAGVLLTPEPAYSLSPAGKFKVARQTYNLKVPYYVKEDFSKEYSNKGSLKRLEAGVEDEYVTGLRSNCFKERTYKENMMWRAQSYGDRKMYEKAQSLQTPSCDTLQELYRGR